MAKIDLETATNIRRILMLCRSRGTDPVAALDLAGLLRHPKRLQQDIINLIDVSIIPTLRDLRGDATVKTPMDMRELIIKGLERFRDDIQKQLEATQ